MGICTDTDVVKFVSHGVLFLDDNDMDYDINDNNQLFMLPEVYLEGEFIGQAQPVQLPLVVNGWEYHEFDDTVCKLGKHGRIYGDKWTKDDHTVFLVNESKYESVGEVDMAVIADTKEDVEFFCQDNGLQYTIEEDDAVQQWS